MTIYDLSQPIETGMTTYPGDPDVAVDAHATHAADGVRVSAVAMGSHTGTHVDAPSHTEAGDKDIDAFDVETFAFEARVVRLNERPREPITTADLVAGLSTSEVDSADDAESTSRIDCLVLHTGWDVHWNSDTYRDHPYLTADAAAWCASRGYHVGIDALNVDPTPTDNATDDEPSDLGAHHGLLGAGKVIVENLRGLDRVPDEFTLYAFPLTLVGADGAPVRAVAVT